MNFSLRMNNNTAGDIIEAPKREIKQLNHFVKAQGLLYPLLQVNGNDFLARGSVKKYININRLSKP